MAEQRINGQPQRYHNATIGGAVRPSECRDDRPTPRELHGLGETTVSESHLGRAMRAASSPDPGGKLREARQARGLSLEDVSRPTKINLSTLKALEENDINKLPATIFTRGFLKAYAREVGLDPDETADSYLAQIAPETLVADAETARLKTATPLVRDDVLAYDEDMLVARRAGRFGRLMTAAAVVGLVAYVWSYSRNGSSTPTESTSIQPPVATDVAKTGGAATPDPASAVTAASLESPDALQFELRPQGPCWFSASADGNPVVSGLLQAGDLRTIEVRDELVLRVGDPAAFTFSINGKTGRPLGRAGQPVNVRITKANFRDFLSS